MVTSCSSHFFTSNRIIRRATLFADLSEKGQEDYLQEWVRKFVVVQNITVVEQEKPLFGFLDDWLMANILSDTTSRTAMGKQFERNIGSATQCHEDSPLGAVEVLSHSDAHLVAWEVMKMFWMTQAILASIELESHDSIENSILPKGRAPVVLFKDFTAVTIQGPRLTATPRMREPNGERIGGSKSLAMRLDDVFYDSEQSIISMWDWNSRPSRQSSSNTSFIATSTCASKANSSKAIWTWLI